MDSIIIMFDTVKRELQTLVEKVKDQAPSSEILLIQESGEPEDVSYLECRYYHVPKGTGFAATRNKGLEVAMGDIIVFIDDDCDPTEDWYHYLLGPFKDPKIMATMGSLRIPKSTYLGDCISELGFPAGANAGFENMWKVDDEGFTNHLSTCNCAIRRKVFNHIGLFDKRLVYGAEDAEFSHRMDSFGYQIKYVPDAIVYHEARANFSSFLQWQLRRGKANYYFKQVVGDIGSHLRLRLWSSKNILKKNIFSLKIFGVFSLLFLSFLYQQLGYMRAARNENIDNKNKGKNP